MFIKIDDRTIVNVEKVESITRLPNGRVVLSSGTEDIAYADTDGYADSVWEYFNSIAMVPGVKEEVWQERREGNRVVAVRIDDDATHSEAD